jgi:protein-tyrosine phosphatase
VFRILTVCSGNICRSPVVERVLRARLADIPEIQIASAGTMAVVGEGMPLQAAAMAVELGGDPDGHIARQITTDLVDDADLILVAAREHRAAVAQLVPRASRKTFTLREFARLAENEDTWATPLGDESSNLASLPSFVAELAARRGSVRPEDPSDDDVIDPYRRDDAVYRQSRDEMAPAIDVVADRLRRAAGR